MAADSPPPVPAPLLASFPSDLLTPDQIAAQLRVSPITVRDWITVGVTINDPQTYSRKRIALKARKVGGRWKIAPGDVEAFIQMTTACSTAGGPEVVDPDAATETPRARKARADACMKELEAELNLSTPGKTSETAKARKARVNATHKRVAARLGIDPPQG